VGHTGRTTTKRIGVTRLCEANGGSTSFVEGILGVPPAGLRHARLFSVADCIRRILPSAMVYTREPYEMAGDISRLRLRGLVAADGHANLGGTARRPNRERINGASVATGGFGCISGGPDAIAFSAFNSFAGWRPLMVTRIWAVRHGGRIENASTELRLLQVDSDASRVAGCDCV
jgi:hypothetical protein